MRSSVQSWSMKILLGALVLSFVSFYGWQAGSGCQGNSAAEVDGEYISAEDYQLRVQMVESNYRSLGLLQDNMSDAMRDMLRRNILDSMITERVKSSAAEDLGIAPAHNAIRENIRKQFSTEDGDFDFELYQRILKYRLHKTPSEYEKAQERAHLAQEFDQLISQTAFIPEPELRTRYEQKNNTVSLWYAEATAPALGISKKKDISIQPEEVKTHFEANKQTYKLPEERDLEIIWVDVKDLANPTQEDLEAELEETFPKEQYGTTHEERIHAAHILLRVTGNNEASQLERALNIRRALTQGGDFWEIARKESEDSTRTKGGDLGYFGLGKMVKEFEKAAFALKVGQISNPVKSQFGFHIIKLLDRIPSGPRTVAHLKNELVYRWKEKALDKDASNNVFMAKADDLLKKAKAKGEKKKTLKDLDVDSHLKFISLSKVKRGDKIEGFADGAQINRMAQTLKEGSISDPIRGLTSSLKFLVRVTKIHPSAIPEFSSVKAKVEEDLRKKKENELIEKKTEQLLASWIKKNLSVEEAKKKTSLEFKETSHFSPTSSHRIPGVGVNAEVMKEAFNLTPENPYMARPHRISNRWYVFALKERKKPDWEKFKKDFEDLQRVAEEEEGRQRTRSWTEALKKDANIKKFILSANAQ